MSLQDIRNAKTKEELHTACWARKADSTWIITCWGLFVVPPDFSLQQWLPLDYPRLGLWETLHDPCTGAFLQKKAVLVDCQDSGRAWRLAVELGHPVLVPAKGCTILLPPDASPSQSYPAGPLGAIKAFGVVFGVGRLGWAQCLAIRGGPEIPGFPKLYQGSGVLVKGKTIPL